LIDAKPPQIFQELGSRNIRDFVPYDRFATIFSERSRETNSLDLLHLLSIKMDFPTMLESKTFDLLDDAAFGSVLAVEKGRNHGETQVKPAFPVTNMIQHPESLTLSINYSTTALKRTS